MTLDRFSVTSTLPDMGFDDASDEEIDMGFDNATDEDMKNDHAVFIDNCMRFFGRRDEDR